MESDKILFFDNEQQITQRLSSCKRGNVQQNTPTSTFPMQVECNEKDRKAVRRKPSAVLLCLIFVMCAGFTCFIAKRILQLISNSSISYSSNVDDLILKREQKRQRTTSIELDTIISEVESILDQVAVPCHATFTGESFETSNLCPGQEYNSDQIVIYNPSNHDKFICGGKIVLGPKKLHVLDKNNLDVCWTRPIETLLTAHSFPLPPTHDNILNFPGIVVQSSQSRNRYDDTFSSSFVSQRTLMASKDSSAPSCDVKCDFETLTGINQHRYVYGTDWEIIMSMEGEQYYPQMKIDPNAWNENKFYATTSFESEVPLPYFSFAEYNIQNPAVPFEDGIKGASFLARNCDSMNNREAVVQKLMKTDFRIDSLSSCLKNVDNPDLDLSNKGKVLSKYLFHLAFENQNTNDYITEKLWGTLSSGTIPVYFGAPNAKEHVTFNGVIFVDDFPTIDSLAEYLMKVSNDKELYDSYHSWREEPLPETFLAKYNISRTHSKCRTCRWAHARKYGLGWNHTSQTIEPLVLERETCIRGSHLRTPAVESWVKDSPRNNDDTELELINFDQLQSSCPLIDNDISRAKVGNDELTRSIWSNDGTTDIYIEGRSLDSYILRLAFPLEQHGSHYMASLNLVWAEDDRSRVSIAIKSNPEWTREISSVVTVESGVFEVRISPEMLPLRIRIIVENVDTLHKRADEHPSYYGQRMLEDMMKHPHLFSVAGSPDLTSSHSLKYDSEQFNSYSAFVHVKEPRHKNAMRMIH